MVNGKQSKINKKREYTLHKSIYHTCLHVQNKSGIFGGPASFYPANQRNLRSM